MIDQIGAAVLPDYLEEKFRLTHRQWQFAQLTFPVFTQLVTTPCHLLGLDYFNHNTDSTMMERLSRVRKGYIGAVGVRMIRMWYVGIIYCYIYMLDNVDDDEILHIQGTMEYRFVD